MRYFFFSLLLAVALPLMAQVEVKLNPQHCFPKSIPAGNYSGIAWLGGNRYAVVSDKSAEEGFFVFEIVTDTVTGEIKSARNLGFRSSHAPGRDNEGIAYNPSLQTLFITGEQDNVIRGFHLDGSPTGQAIQPAPAYSRLPGNLGLEALSYDSVRHRLWTCNEAMPIIIQGYDDDLNPVDTFHYTLDAPVADRAKAQFYAHGVGTLTALPDGTMLLLEREFYVPPKKLGSFVNCKLYQFFPGESRKTLLAQWKTHLTLFSRNIANYEGMCLGPRLSDGSRVMLLVADSQNQYRGVLRDYLKSLRIRFPAP